MVYDYSADPLSRKHEPAGYEQYHSYKAWLRDEFTFRCAYCLHRETWEKDGSSAFVIDHFEPQVHFPDKVCDYNNLFYTCSACNGHKKDSQLPFDPERISLGTLIRFETSGEVTPLNQTGEILIAKLRLDLPTKTQFRQKIYELYRDGLKKGDRSFLQKWFGFPSDLPNLKTKRPPQNKRRDGLQDSWHAKKGKGQLPELI